MSETERQQPSFRFGIFELDRRTGELRKHGVKLKLQDQPVKILALLLEHPGELVTREDIQKRLWPEQTYVDFDNAINSAVRKLRDALGDSSENPRYVETLPRRGYRFIAPVSVANHASEEDRLTVYGEMASIQTGREIESPGCPSRINQLRRWRRPRPATAVAIILVLLGGVSLLFLRIRSNNRAMPISTSPLTSSLGSESFPSFSPDGNYIAFTWNGPRQDNWDIYVKLIGGGEPSRLTSAPAIDISPAWSPDGRQIAFLRPLSQQISAVMVVPVLGGVEKKLTETPNFDLHTGRPLSPPRLLAWSHDAEWLVIAESTVPGGGTDLVAYSVSTGNRRRLTDAHAQYGDVDPAFSPDGRMVAFTRRETIDVSDLYVLAVGGDLRPTGPPKRITSDHRRTGQPAWSSDGRTLIFASNRGGTSGLWRVPVDATRPPEPVPFAGDGAASPVLSQDGQRLAYVRSISDSNIWKVNVPAPGRPVGQPVKLIASSAIDEMPHVSRDGKVAFCSSRSGSREIWVESNDGSPPVQLTSFGQHSGTPRWSPDGTQIAFDSNVSGVFQIYVVSAEGGRPRLVTPGSSESVIPSWSRDGQWIYYCSARTGRREIWKVSLTADNPQQVTRNGGYAAFESWSGRWLYYKGLDLAGPLWRIPIGGGTAEQLPGTETLGRHFDVSGKGIYFYRPRKTGSTVAMYRFETGTIETVFMLPTNAGMGLAVSPDDQQILYSQIDYSGSNIMVVDHYQY
jgi:Tol biopolymer transport system component/DNA-binding winged helix-turn-helix (wHTH) protein